eukprot:1157251-Pelagomonas_calceolata.AAC.11
MGQLPAAQIEAQGMLILAVTITQPLNLLLPSFVYSALVCKIWVFVPLIIRGQATSSGSVLPHELAFAQTQSKTTSGVQKPSDAEQSGNTVLSASLPSHTSCVSLSKGLSTTIYIVLAQLHTV